MRSPTLRLVHRGRRAYERSPNRVDRRDEALVEAVAVAHQDAEQKARVQLVRPGEADIASPALGPASRVDELADPNGFTAPPRRVSAGYLAVASKRDCAHERGPARHLG